MSKSGIFSNNFASLDHIILTQYGELKGKTLLPSMSVLGLTSDSMQSVIATATLQVNRYINKIWILESLSKCTLRVVGEDSVWKVYPFRSFPEGMFDETNPGSLFDYQNKVIEITTTAFTAVIDGADLRIISVLTLEDGNSSDEYWQYVTPLIEKSISDVLKVVYNSDIDVSLSLDPLTKDYLNLENTVSDYAKVYKNQYGKIEYRGYSTRIYTKDSYASNRIGDYIQNSIFLNVQDMNIDMDSIVSGEYSFVMDYSNQYNETNRNIKTIFLPTTPTINSIVSHYASYINPIGYQYLQMTEGSSNGALSSRP